MPNWQTEFPDYPACDMPDIPASFTDISWHNDGCPCFLDAATGLVIWAGWPDAADREGGQDAPRFIVQLCANRLPDAGWQFDDATVTLFTAEDWQDVQDFLDSIPRTSTIEEAGLYARMRLNQLTVADAGGALAIEEEYGRKGGRACPDLMAEMRAIIAKAEG